MLHQAPEMRKTGCRTDFYAGSVLCGFFRVSVIASAGRSGAGDGIHANTVVGCPVSRGAIAAELALDGLSVGERLVALTLASYAGRDHRAWPGAPAAGARAGLGRSRYLEARDRLERRGLLEVGARATGRGRAATVLLVFAQSGRGGRAMSTRSCSRRFWGLASTSRIRWGRRLGCQAARAAGGEVASSSVRRRAGTRARSSEASAILTRSTIDATVASTSSSRRIAPASRRRSS